jgi:mevalonate kinase
MIISLRKFLSWSVLKQIKIEISTAIPIGSGLGSSGSFAVCLASTFLILANKIDLKNHPNLTRDDLNLINKYAFFIEKIFHGNPSGIDNTVSTFGNYVVYKKGFDIESFSVNLNLPILVVNSCLPKKTIEQVAKVRDLYNKHMLVIEPLFESIENIVNKYVLILKETRNISELNDLISINQGILNCLQVSNLELNKIIDISQSFGFQAKITGAGGGGCCYVLLDQSTELKKNLIQKLNENSFVSFEVCLGDKGILIDEIAF